MAENWRNRSRYPEGGDERPWGGQGTWEGENWAGGTEYPDEQRTFGGGDWRGRPGMPRFGSGYGRDSDLRGSDWPDYDRTWRGDRDYGYGYGSRGERERRDFRQGRGMWANQRGRSDWQDNWARRSRGDFDQGRSWNDQDRWSEQGRGERGFWDKASDEVSSWFGDEDAERRRRMDEARGEHRGRGPKGYVRSDERIREDVSDALTDDPYLDAREIEVSVANGEVTLIGTIDHRWAKRRAEDCAEDVSGVRHVQNNLRVRESTSMGTSTGATTGSLSSGQTGSSATSTGMSVRGSNQKV